MVVVSVVSRHTLIMLTTLFSSNTGMQARQMLERKPPTCTSTLSSTNSFSALRRERRQASTRRSAELDLERPAVDAAGLVDAVDRHLQADHRGLAAERGRAGPRLQQASRRKAPPPPRRNAPGGGTSMVAPNTPAPKPTRRRRVILSLFEKSCDHSLLRSIFQSLRSPPSGFSSTKIISSGPAGQNHPMGMYRSENDCDFGDRRIGASRGVIDATSAAAPAP